MTDHIKEVTFGDADKTQAAIENLRRNMPAVLE